MASAGRRRRLEDCAAWNCHPPRRARSPATTPPASHPAVLEALERCNDGHALAYGADDAHRGMCGPVPRPVRRRRRRVELTFNGTGANIVALATMLGSLPGPNHAVVCTDWAHINADETGAPERILGTKLIDLPVPDAKLVPEQLAELAHLQGVQHHVAARGGVASPRRPSSARSTPPTRSPRCATRPTAWACSSTSTAPGSPTPPRRSAATPAALRSFTIDAGVDALSFGGTKNGLMGAEAVVFCNPAGRRRAGVRPQAGRHNSPPRCASSPPSSTPSSHDDLWIDLAAHANAMAAELYARTSCIDGVDLGGPPAVNSVFPSLPRPLIERAARLVLLLGLGRRPAIRCAG